MKRRSWLIIGPYVLVVAVAVFGFSRLESEAHQRCLDRQADRQVLRQVVDIATTPTGSANFDLTTVPGFSDLDPQTQVFITNLSHAITSAPPSSRSSLHDELLGQLPPIDC